MISVRGAIESGAWYHCLNDDNYSEFNFRIGILSFEKQQLTEKEKKQYFDEGGNFWLMKIQVVSLNKTEQLESDDIHDHIHLQDQHGFKFEYLFSPEDSRIFFDEKWGDKLKCFSIFGTNFRPKTKAAGIIGFFLPDDEEGEYYIGVVDGTITEV